MPTATSISNIIATFIHSLEEVVTLIDNPARPAKVKVLDFINQSTFNLVNIKNPDCVGDAFGYAIIATNNKGWVAAIIARINKVNKTTAIKTPHQEDATTLAVNPL